MVHLLQRINPFLLQRVNVFALVFCVLGAAALLGWASFAYSAWSGRQLSFQITVLTAERDEARSRHERLQRAAGDLSQVEARLGAVNGQFNHVLRTLAAAEYQLSQKRRSDQAQEPATTGATQPAQASKRADRSAQRR